MRIIKEARTCDNDSSMGTGIGGISQCYKGKVEYEVEIIYGAGDSDTLYLCSDCMKEVKRDAQRHGYKVNVKKYRG